MTPLPQQRPVVIALLLAASILASGCRRPPEPTSSGAIRVVVSIEPLAMIVREIAGELARVSTLLPAGADPHHYEVRPRKIVELARADLIVSVGGGFDGWAEGLCAGCETGARRLRVLELPGITAEPTRHDGHEREAGGHEEALDPHVWLDPLRVRDVIAPALVTTLGELAPEHRGAFEAGLARLDRMLSQTDRDLRALFADRERDFVALHPAWRYFASRYALEQRAVLAPTPGINPSAKSLADTIRACRAEEIETLVLEATDSKRRGAAIAEALGVDALVLDPLGVPAAPGNLAGSAPPRLVDLYRVNAERLAAALPAHRTAP